MCIRDRFTSGVADNDFLKVAGTTIEGRSSSEVLSDIGGQSALTFGISSGNVPTFTSGVVDNDFLKIDGTTVEGRSASEVLSDIGGQASLTFGISNTNAVKIDSTSVADDEYARFTANGLEGRTLAEIKSDIGTGNSALVPSAGTSGHFLKHDGTFGQVAYSNLSGTPTIPTNYVTNDADDEMLGTLTLKKASDDATCRELIFLKERASSVSSNDGDLAGEITFKAYNDAGTPELVEVAQISATFADVSDSNETGKLEFKVAPPDEFSESNTAVTGLTLQGAGGNFTHVDVTMGTSQGTVAHNCPDNIFRYGSSSSSGRMLFQPANPGGGGTTNTTFIMEAWNDADDIFKILVDDVAATTISTVDDGGAAGHLTLDIDGDITLDAASGNIYVKDNGGNYTPGSDYEIATKKYVDDNAGGASALNDLSDVTYSSGDLTISSLDTIVAGANLTIDAVGDIILDADGGDVIFKDSGTTFASTSNAGMMIETGGTQVVYGVDQIMYDGDDLLQYNTNELTITNYLKIAESASANSDSAGKGQIWVKNDTPNNLYFTNDAGNDVQITSGSSLAGGGGTQCWTFTLGGYMLNNNSTTNYYTSFYTNYFYWLNSDSSPTSISYTDAYTYNYKAPKAGVLTKICVTARATRTDPFKIYVYKAAPATGDTSTSATLIGTSDTITPPATNQLVVVDTTISSSNTFSAGDALYVWLKKDSTSGSQSIYFTITIQGDYS